MPLIIQALIPDLLLCMEFIILSLVQMIAAPCWKPSHSCQPLASSLPSLLHPVLFSHLVPNFLFWQFFLLLSSSYHPLFSRDASWWVLILVSPSPYLISLYSAVFCLLCIFACFPFSPTFNLIAKFSHSFLNCWSFYLTTISRLHSTWWFLSHLFSFCIPVPIVVSFFPFHLVQFGLNSVFLHRIHSFVANSWSPSVLPGHYFA